MVFESIVTELLNKYLGEYVENLDSSQLSIGIWGGDVVLTDLSLKQSALDDLNLPVKTVYGHLGKLVLKIPWKNLYTAPTQVLIERLFLLVVPNQEIKYDPVKEEKWKQEEKQAEIERVEAAKRRELEKDLPKADDTFTEKLVAQIVRNVQITITDIHIRYEDRVSSPTKPFSLGITLHNFAVITTDRKWVPAINQTRTGHIFKHLTIDGLSVYLNSKSELFCSINNEKLLLQAFKEGIPKAGTLVAGYKYMVGPISSTAKLQLNMNPEQDKYKIPKAILQLHLKIVHIRISKFQYCDIVALLESLDRMARASVYRKYRPAVKEYKGHYKIWWKYAYTCILEEEVRRKRKNWDWLHIKTHREVCHQYADAYQTKLTSHDKSCFPIIKKCETQLDAFNIVLIRQRIEVEVEREGRLKEQTASQKGWFSGWWSSKEDTPADDKVNFKKQFQEAMTSSEKEKLFKAIDYQENLIPANYPVEFVEADVQFTLESLEIIFRDDDLPKPEVMVIYFKHVGLHCEERPTTSALKFAVQMYEFSITGLEQNNTNPKICECVEQLDANKKHVPLIKALFETSPLDGNCDTRVHVECRPLRIIYDAHTVNQLIDIFTPEEDKSSVIHQLQMAANMKLAEMKEKSAVGLQYAIQQHSRLELKIKLMASYIIVPHSGFYTDVVPLLVWNLGSFSIESVAKGDTVSVKAMHKSGAREQEIMERVISESYDKFILKIENMQIMLAHPGEPWMKHFENSDDCELYLLHPTTLNVDVQKCLITDDPRLPKLKINGTLPNVTLRIQETRLFDTISLLLSIPFSEKKAVKPQSALDDQFSAPYLYGSSSSLFKFDTVSELASKRARKKSTIVTGEEEILQFTDLEANFQLNEVVVEILKQRGVAKNIPFLTLNVITVEAGMLIQTFNMNVHFRVGGFSVTQAYKKHEVIRLITSPLASGENDYLLVFKYQNVDRNSPDFHSYYKSVLQLIDVDFSKLHFIVHQEALMLLIQWCNEIYCLFDLQKLGPKEVASNASQKQSSQLHLPTILESVSVSKTAKKGKKKPVETIDLKLRATMSEIGVTLVNRRFKLARMEIAGGVASIIMKRSYTQIDAKLSDLQVIDFMESYHPKILSILGKEELLTLQLVIFNEELQRKSDNINMSLTASVACIRVVFLNRFVKDLMNFLNNFQMAQEAIKEASAAAAEAAKVNMQQAYSAALKISFNISLKAPLIIVPVYSLSNDAIAIDFGNLTITNSFQDVVVRDNDDHVAVLDNLRLCLENVKVSRILSDGEVNKNEKNLLDPITFQLFVQRNLSSAWFTDKPDLDVGGHLGSIYVKLSKDDSALIMTILNKNFAEGSDPEGGPVTVDSYDKVRPVPSASKKSTTSTKTVSDVQSMLSDKPAPVRSGRGDHEVYTIIKFTLRLESIIIELFENRRRSVGKGSINPSQPPSPEKEISLSRLKVHLLSLKGSLLSDDTYTFSALLVDFLIDDTRLSQEKKINRYMERVIQEKSSSTDSSSYKQKSMIDITVRLKDNSLFVDLRVFSFLLILNLQYLMKLAEFFTVDESKEEVVAIEQKGVASLTSIATEHSIRNMQKRSTSEGMTVINICIEKPDIILVENLDDVNTNALILEMQILMKLRLLNNLHQVISGTVKDLQLFTCCYNPARRHQTKSQVLRHVTINLAGSTPVNKGLHLDLCTTDIHFSFTPDTIELLNSCYQTLYSEMGKTPEDEIENEDYSDAWEISKYDNSDFWFLRSEQGTEAFESLEMDFSESHGLSEICLVSIPSIVITLEAGIGTHTMPLLLVDSCVKGTVNNWSSQLTAEMQITLQVGYFNSRCAMWEPLVEPVEVISHGLSSKHPWELSLKLEKRENLKKGSLDSDDSSEDKAPITAITITSEETMELSISKTCLHVLQSLGTAFNDALYKPHMKGMTPQAPYVIKNETGLPIKVKLSDVPFQVLGDTNNIKEVLVNPGAEVNLCLLENPLLASVVHFTTAVETAAVEKFIVVSIEDDDFELEIPVSRAEKRYFSIKGNNSQEQQGLISDVAVNYGSVIVTLCSIIRVYNHFQEEISVFFMTNKGDEIQLVGCVQPDSYLNLPFNAVYTPTGELFFSVPGHSFSVTPYIWKELRNTLSLTELLQCNSKNVEDNEPFFIKAVGDMEQVYFELSNRYTMSSTCYNIHLRPTVILKNFLPVDIIACIQGVATERLLNSGDRMVLPTVEPGSSSVTIRISGYLDKEWSCKRAISESPPELEVWTFESYDSPQRVTFDLGMHSVNKHGSLILALYCPFWMLNKTGLSLCYRRSTKPDRSDDTTIPTEQADDMSNILYHPETYTEPVMFSFRAKYFFGKKKACIRVQNGEWSEKFSLDVAGSFGVVNCKVKDETYQVGVHIELCYNTLTKQVTFTPYHIIVNQCSRPINFCEVGTWTKWLKVDEESCLPFWPTTQNKEMVVRFDGTVEETVPFPFSTIHDSLLKLENKYGGIDVNVQMTEGAIYVTFSDFKKELAASLLINHMNEDLVLEEKNSGLTFTLPRSHKKLFCWSNFSDGKQLTWGGGKYSSDLYKDDIGEFKINDSIKGFYVSFLDGMQRILLFTNDIMIAHEAQNANIIEAFDQEMTFSIHGLGISLVDNIKQHEILYLGITSSGIVWESSAKITKRFKPLAEGLSNALEDCYQSYSQEKMLGKDNPVKVVGDKTVDFENLVFVKPSTRYLKRTYRTGLWLQMRTSSHQFQLHARVNRLQIDNQMYSCVFPVILAPVPPPKTVSNASAFKPFAEVSIVEMRNEHTTVVQYKYFKVLVQEFHIKLDIGFINAIVDFFEAGEISDTLEASQFQIDRQLVEKQLKDHISILSSQQQKNFYDFLHFSPLKIHLSFSLSGGGHSGLTGLPPFVSVLTQSLGVTLTDMQDVVFKLSYFERQYTFLSMRQLINEVQMHYIGQLFKQAYVLVFGLDVLGNPYGLVVGFKQGVEDLFYEPFQGAIQGPGEFAEGFYLGVRSLVGHTIGGAAGAMSRITGAMGKGLAALTFDEEYQRKRREQMNVASTSLPESMAQSGKGLVMGVVHGVGGVFMKPITGAKEEGVEGFFKGVGKGMVGLITRPTAGAVDFASGTFSSVRKIAQMSEEVLRMRSPRHFKVDRILRPYSRQEAEGQKLLLEVDKGRLQATDLYAYHTPIGHKDILLLTDKRIAYLVNDVFGGYQIDWSYTWEEIGGVHPRIVGNTIVLTVTEPRKTFFKTVASKKVLLIPDVEQRKVVLSKITHCMSPKKGSLRSSVSSSAGSSV